jgi:predicted dehydrogenase
VVIDNDELTFIHATPPGSEGEERAYGSLGSSENQVADYVTEPEAGAETLRVDLETNRQAIAIITGAYESARTGRPVRLV